MQKRMKLWIFLNTPSPYQVDFIRGLRESGLFEVHARFMSAIHRGRVGRPEESGIGDIRILKGYGPHIWSDAFRIHPEALREVQREKFDLFILGGQYTSMTFALTVRLLGRRHCWMAWLERPWPEDFRPAWSRSLSSRSRTVGWIRKHYLRAVLCRASAVLVIGTAACREYRRLTGHQVRVENFPYVCDTARFQPADAAMRRSRMRRELGLADDQVVLLYCGQLIERKGVDVLIRALEAAELPEARLVIVGDGPLRDRLRELANTRLKDRVLFSGNVPYDRVPEYYLAADLFVFPTLYDGWGVVINEACAAGLPVICSRAAGAAADLVCQERNGILVEAGDVGALTVAIRRLAGDPDLRRKMGVESRRIIESYSPIAASRRLWEIAVQVGAGRRELPEGNAGSARDKIL